MKTKLLTFLSLGTITLGSLTATGITSCGNVDPQPKPEKTIDGINWDGYVSGGFTNEFYTIDEINKTVTYFGISRGGGSTPAIIADYEAKDLVIPSKISINNGEYSVKIGNDLFDANKKLTGLITISEGIKEIGDNSFQSLGSSTEGVDIILPQTVKAIGDSAFYGLTCKNSIFSLPKNTNVGDYAFGYTNFKNIDIFNTNQKLGAKVFSACKTLEKIIFNDFTVIPGEWDPASFTGISSTGQIVLKNCTVDPQEFLDFLKNSCGLAAGWTL